MTVVITILADDNARNRRRKRRAEQRAQNEAHARLARKIAVAGSGCSLNVARATSLPGVREKSQGGAMCIPQVAIFAAGYRKSKQITAR